ncbi:hypothetical protein L211DRAFT_52764 [Terfezia boudieri ATCC MYA-4762]|uniref:Uncharacterized protein n=1 Tax=Terfezia boudieri ATCC MYA-4762 TaxID=1051890 RepID=A0A3N4M455_9PEZI|nr:hypothetical protein L211DRAFT_52764 [Terfezia boudieri ATCC MYA-4762]
MYLRAARTRGYPGVGARVISLNIAASPHPIQYFFFTSATYLPHATSTTYLPHATSATYLLHATSAMSAISPLQRCKILGFFGGYGRGVDCGAGAAGPASRA